MIHYLLLLRPITLQECLPPSCSPSPRPRRSRKAAESFPQNNNYYYCSNKRSQKSTGEEEEEESAWKTTNWVSSSSSSSSSRLQGEEEEGAWCCNCYRQYHLRQSGVSLGSPGASRNSKSLSSNNYTPYPPAKRGRTCSSASAFTKEKVKFSLRLKPSKEREKGGKSKKEGKETHANRGESRGLRFWYRSIFPKLKTGDPIDSNKESLSGKKLLSPEGARQTSTSHSKQNHHERFKKFLQFCATGFRRRK